MSHLKYCHDCKRLLPFIGETCPKCPAASDQSSVKANFFISGQKLSLDSRDEIFIPGDIVAGRYEIIRPLNDSLFLARDNILGDLMLKVMAEGPEEILNQFKNNPMIASLVKLSGHDHLCRIYDFVQTRHSTKNFIVQVMEYCQGLNLKQFMQMFPDLIMRLHMCLPVLAQVCKALAVLQAKQIPHLDLRPENILLSDNGAKICDYGVLHYSFDPSDDGDFLSRRIIHKTSSPTYMSPELARADRLIEIDHQADIYSLGIILLKLCSSGSLPPNGLSSLNQISSLEIEVPIRDIIERCLQVNPADRFVGFHELGAALEALTTVEAEPEEGEDNADAVIPEIDDSSVILDKTQALYDRNQFNEALELLQRNGFNMSPATEALQRQINVRRDKAGRIYSYIDNNFESGNLSSLIELLKEAVEIYPEHPDGCPIQIKLSHMASNYNATIEAGNTALTKMNWEGALEAFTRALSFDNDQTILRHVSFLSKITGWREEIDQALGNDDFAKARNLACLVDEHVEKFYSVEE